MAKVNPKETWNRFYVASYKVRVRSIMATCGLVCLLYQDR
jgi:hypothetical protein